MVRDMNDAPTFWPASGLPVRDMNVASLLSGIGPSRIAAIRDGEDCRAHCAYIAGNPRTPDYEYLELEGPSLDRPPVGLSG